LHRFDEVRPAVTVIDDDDYVDWDADNDSDIDAHVISIGAPRACGWHKGNAFPNLVLGSDVRYCNVVRVLNAGRGHPTAAAPAGGGAVPVIPVVPRNKLSFLIIN
jgi:hypothetical protein